MKYKAGDKVRIKDLETLPQVLRGKVMQIKRVYSNNYDMTELLCPVFWTDELIEGLVEEEDKTVKTEVFGDTIFYPADAGERLEIIRNNNYQFKDENGNVINATKIVLEKKKKEYPKTFRECQECLGEDVPPMEEPDSKTHRRRQVHLLEVLLICRDAYWKLYGEDMGLGIPWKPSWDKCTGEKYCISSVLNAIRHDAVSKSEYHNRILAFPTEEMRDAFYENFKALIESVKELL